MSTFVDLQVFLLHDRILELAKPQPLSADFHFPRDPVWKVSHTTRSAVATELTLNLSRPLKRPDTAYLQFNPKAYFVKPGAKKASASSRTIELAKPTKRK